MTERSPHQRRRRSSSAGLADGYRMRLADAIRNGYPKLAAALGDVAFDALVVTYLQRYPSTRLSERSGDHLPELLFESTYPTWLGELAQLDRAHGDVLDADLETPMTRDALRETATIRLVLAHQLITLTTSVHETWNALARRDPIVVPRQLDWPSAILVWCGAPVLARGSQTTLAERPLARASGPVPCIRMRVGAADEIAALRLAAVGARLDEIAKSLTATNAIARAIDLVLRWIDDGVVAYHDSTLRELFDNW